jgi:diaminohydroxyphosphoribosylaminopyrimidine deaminase/5-amino-6-(5-phosphoribosylamino)uracil reductase
MRRALELAGGVRARTSPNPWVGAVILDAGGEPAGEGATSPPGGPHAEVAALFEAGERARGGTAVVTLEPCVHYGRTGPCVEALISAGIRRVVVGLTDPDDRVNGRGVAALRSAGAEVATGVLAAEGEHLLKPYLVHRRSLRPFVVLKLAVTLDGRVAAPDGTSRWITGPQARDDVHRIRGESDAVLVGAGTVRADDPELTVRPAGGEGIPPAPVRQPLRVVLGRASGERRVHPALEVSGDLRGVLDDLGRRGILQLLVEGGSQVAGEFHRLGLVGRYVIYTAPVMLGGDDGVPVLAGRGAQTMAAAWRGRLVSVTALGDDVRIEVEPQTRLGLDQEALTGR